MAYDFRQPRAANEPLTGRMWLPVAKERRSFSKDNCAGFTLSASSTALSKRLFRTSWSLTKYLRRD